MTPQRVVGICRAVACSISSLKGNKATSPNQDRALCASLAGGAVGLLAVMDGHGESGHTVAEVVCQALPKLVLRQLAQVARGKSAAEAHQSGAPRELLPQSAGASQLGGAPWLRGPVLQPSADPGAEWWREATSTAYQHLHSLLSACTSQTVCSGSPPEDHLVLDARNSGTTATVVLLLPGQRLLLSHVGDSGVALGVRSRLPSSNWVARSLTRDHKPDLPEETARIELAGAQVVQVGQPPNITHRVVSSHQTWPSINMSRSLGDLHAHTQGLSSVPDVVLTEPLWDPAEEEAVVIAGSDGLWDVMSPETAAEIAGAAQEHGADPAASLAAEAFQRWMQRGLQGCYSDDISVVVKFL